MCITTYKTFPREINLALMIRVLSRGNYNIIIGRIMKYVAFLGVYHTVGMSAHVKGDFQNRNVEGGCRFIGDKEVCFQLV